jgi:hypothetical protein
VVGVKAERELHREAHVNKRLILNKEQRNELLFLACKAHNLASLLKDAAHLGEKGHPAIANSLDAVFKTLQQIIDRTKEFIKCL